MVAIDDVRALALRLPRTTEALVRDRVKFRVGRIVYLAFSRDETVMGFAFPKEEREALVRSEPEKFLMPTGATSATTGCSSAWPRSITQRCANWSSRPGGWWYPRRSRRPSTGRSDGAHPSLDYSQDGRPGSSHHPPKSVGRS